MSTPLLVLLIIGVAAPLVAVLVRAVTGFNDQPSALHTLLEPRHLSTLANTVLLGAMVVVIATLLAAPLAFLMSWTRMRNHLWVDVVLMVPFMTPPYVVSLAWLDFTRVNGLAEQVFGTTGGGMLRGVIESPFGMALVMASEIFTFLYLILRTQFDAIPASINESAAIAGASAGQRLRRILTPLMTKAYSLGALVVFIRAAGEFGTPVTLGNKIGFPVLVSEIHRAVTIDPLDFPHAAALSSVLLGLGVTVWGLQQWIARRPAPFGGRAPRRATVDIGGWAAAGWAWFGGVVLVSVVIPYVSIILGSMTILRSQPLTLENLTFDFYPLVLTTGSGVTALQNSATLAFIAATLATAIGVACALAIGALRTRPLGRFIDLLSVASDTIPAIVLAIGLIFLWNAPWMPVTPYNTPAMLVIGYAVILLPMVVQNVRTSRDAIDDRLLEAASVGGATPAQSFVRVVLPLLVPGIVSGWLLGFLLGIREVVISSLLRPASFDLLSPWIMSEFDQGFRAQAMAMTVIGVLGSTLVLIVVDSLRRRHGARRLA